MKKDFVHLHVHSHYSLLSALPKIKELVAYAKKSNMTALALTDDGNMYGAIEFYKECKKNDIKPILGIDCYLAERTRFDKQAGIDNRRTRVVLLAKNNVGYKHLIQITTKAHLEGFYYKPRADKELLQEYKDGLIAIVPAETSDVAHAIRDNDLLKAEALLSWYKKTFQDNLYVALSSHTELENHDTFMKATIELARKLNIPVVATHALYYLEKEDRLARQTLMSVQSGGGRERTLNPNEDFSFKNIDEMCTAFSYIPEAVTNTTLIADACTVELELGTWVFPQIETYGFPTHDDALRDKVYKGIEKRNLENTPEVTARIEYELDIIKKKGYAPYFLVVADLLNFAHSKNILTTIRGSVAGSLVTYLSGITNVNPLEYKLPFERFLNPERPSAPDIDMDYADIRRDEMIEYARAKYGADCVAQIGTFGTMMARGAVRDVARALGFEYTIGDRIAKLIPMGSQGFPMTLDRALEIEEELKKLYKSDDEVKEIIDMAKKIEGCARHISVHAAGVVIAPTTLTDFTPLQFDTKGEMKLITQYDMHGVEDAGLLKFDFLGLRNLSILADAVARVKKYKNIDIDIEKIDLTDKKTFAMLARGETVGLFQLNGTGMTRFLKELKPSTIHDINAMVALYRPGPMESIPQYIERKHNPELVTYLDERLRSILEQSYGVITYQDDVMLIAIHLAGYSWLEADKLRKAMGKKIPEEMEAQKEKLRTGFLAGGLSTEKSEKLWKLIEPFAAYGFNKAHAASYGRVAYQTAYMKANFPAIYMSAVLTAESGDVEKISEIISECKRMNIPVLPPDVNYSFEGFSVIESDKTEHIRFGLTTIKNFGEGIAHSIITEREERGAFTSLSNFLSRITDKNLNKKSLESLIKAGALDSFGERSSLLMHLENLLAYNREATRKPLNQDSLFSTIETSIEDIKLPEAEKLPPSTLLAWEKELLGLYISGHPLDAFPDIFSKQTTTISHIATSGFEGSTVLVPGIITEVKPIITKKGKHMMFISIADYSATIEAVVFPDVCVEYGNIIALDTCVAVKGKLSKRNGTPSIIIEKVKQLVSKEA